MAPKLAHVGLNFGSFFALVFKTLFEAFLDPSWSHFWAQVKGPNMLKVCNCRRFYAFRASSSELVFGSLLGAVLGPFGAPNWAQKRLQEGSKTRSKCELNFGASWEPFWADFRLHLGPQNGSKIGPRALKIPRSISKTTEGPPRSLQIPPGPPRDRTRPGPHRDPQMADFGSILKPIWGQMHRCSNLPLQA